MNRSLIAALILCPTLAFSAGSDTPTPPKKTETSESCENGKVWDKKTKSCVQADSQLLDDDTRYGAERELAYAGRIKSAQMVLAAMSDQTEDRVLTYWGFTNRKQGKTRAALKYYNAALAKNPDNLLARSYMGQLHVKRGNMKLAKAELNEIQTRGGSGTWPETALAQAIKTGSTSNY